MSPKLERLLLRWEELRRDGKPTSADSLCRDCPELREQLLAQIIALEQMDQVLSVPENEQPAAELEPPQTRYDNLRPGWEPIAGYRLEKQLGKGGVGEVWKATGPGGFSVALKFVSLTSQLGASELRSLDVIKTLRHPNLLAIFGAWQVHGSLVIAMELADRTLLDRLNEAAAKRESGIPRDELFKYMQEAAKGLDYLNQPDGNLGDSAKEAIQHRDIKPQNIFVMGGGVKIGDFGLLRILKKTITEHTGSLTLSYAAPEFFMGHTSRSSDQYSLAVTYCHLRGGRLPFTGQPGLIMQGHLQGTPDLTMLPEVERAIVMRALAKKPEKRWLSCGEFISALVASKEVSRGHWQCEPSAWRHVFRTVGITAVLLVLGLLGLWVFRPRGNKTSNDSGPGHASVLNAPSAPDNKEPMSPKPNDVSKESEAHILLRQGRNYLIQEKYLMAYETCTQAIKRDPSLGWAYVERAEAAFHLRQFDQSIDDCTEAIRRGPPEDKDLIWNAYMRRGHANRDKAIAGHGKQDRAIADYSNAIQRWPENGHGYLWRGDAKRHNQDRDGSSADFNEAIRLARLEDKFLLGSAYEKRGHSYREKGRAFADQAIADYTESLKHVPDIGLVYYWRGVAYELKGDRKSAIKDKSVARKLGYFYSGK